VVASPNPRVSSDYALVSRWPIAVGRAQLWEVLDELLASDDPFVWWPAVQVSDYDGTSMEARVASPLGYTLSFTLTDLRTQRPDSLQFASTGDLRGSGTASFIAAGPDTCVIEIDWRVATRRPWMRRTGWLLRPVFVLGHHLVMRQGRRNLASWLARREWHRGPDVV
jgi:hypothetical protein